MIRKKGTSLALALFMCAALLPGHALASEEPDTELCAEEAAFADAAGEFWEEEPLLPAAEETEEPALDGENLYTINGVTVSLYSSSITGNCYTYAMEIYRKIWGTGFSGYSSSSNDMLRNITSLEGRKLTAENVKNYISAAALGSVIRLTNSANVFSSSNGTGHSQLLVQKDANGFTLLESNVTGGRREKYWTWSGYVQWWAVNTSNRGYFQYIEWPGAPAYGGPVDPGTPEVPETCSCSESFAGPYLCTNIKTTLNIRSGHGTSYPVVGSIPLGAIVTVTKADGTWAHVEYNGVSGYASMEYLTKIMPIVIPEDLDGDGWITERDAALHLKKGEGYPAVMALQTAADIRW